MLDNLVKDIEKDEILKLKDFVFAPLKYSLVGENDENLMVKEIKN